MEVTPESMPPVRRKADSAVFCGVIVVHLFLLFAFFISPTTMIEVPLRLAFGWLDFLRINLGEVTFSLARIFTGVVGIGLATGGLHWFARGWRRVISPDGRPWRWRWSAAITGTMLAMSASALSVAGLAHQIAWLKGEPMLEYGFMKFNPMRDARDAAYQLSDFAKAHEGKFPDDLPDLVAWIFGPKGHESDISRLLFFRESQSATPEPWLYFGSGLTTDVPNDLILLASPRPSDRLRFVVTAGGELNYLLEEEFQKALLTQERQ